MEPISWDKISSSKLYRFSIGPENSEFTIHSALVEAQSPALNTFVNNTSFKEACDGHAELQEVDKGTFVAFVEYAYTGSYGAEGTPAGLAPGITPGLSPGPVPGPVPGSASVATQPDNSEHLFGSVSRGRPFMMTKVPKQPATKPKPKMWTTFTTAVSEICPQDHRPRADVAYMLPDNGFAEGLLRHVRVYLFADCYGISRLMNLSLYNLGQTLITLELSQVGGDRVEDIVTLLRYCHDNPTPETLRSLLLRYMACTAERLWKSSNFQELLAAHAELATALVGLMVERLE